MTITKRGEQPVMPESRHDCKVPSRRDRRRYNLGIGAEWKCWCGELWTYTLPSRLAEWAQVMLEGDDPSWYRNRLHTILSPTPGSEEDR